MGRVNVKNPIEVEPEPEKRAIDGPADRNADGAADPAQVPEAFSVVDAQSANWLIRSVGEKRRYIGAVERWAASEIRRAQRDEKFLLERYGRQLEEWTCKQIQQLGGRRRSVCLPAGQAGYRREREKLLVTDDVRCSVWCRHNLPAAIKLTAEANGSVADQLRQWAQQHYPADVRIYEHVMKSILHDHIQVTGECPDGTEVVAGADRFYIE